MIMEEEHGAIQSDGNLILDVGLSCTDNLYNHYLIIYKNRYALFYMYVTIKIVLIVENLEIKCFVLLKRKSTEVFLPPKLCKW